MKEVALVSSLSMQADRASGNSKIARHFALVPKFDSSRRSSPEQVLAPPRAEGKVQFCNVSRADAGPQQQGGPLRASRPSADDAVSGQCETSRAEGVISRAWSWTKRAWR